MNEIWKIVIDKIVGLIIYSVKNNQSTRVRFSINDPNKLYIIEFNYFTNELLFYWSIYNKYSEQGCYFDSFTDSIGVGIYNIAKVIERIES